MAKNGLKSAILDDVINYLSDPSEIKILMEVGLHDLFLGNNKTFKYFSIWNPWKEKDDHSISIEESSNGFRDLITTYRAH